MATVELDLHPLALDRDVLGDDRDDLLLQHGQQIRLADEGALMRQQHLEPLARDRRGIAAAEQAQQIHATALRPNSRPIRPRRSAGTVTTSVSPRSRRAASK